MRENLQNLTFVDLFAGVGGFHAALCEAWNALASERERERESKFARGELKQNPQNPTPQNPKNAPNSNLAHFSPHDFSHDLTRNSAHDLTCLFASEIDLNAQKTYALNFPATPLFGDITSEKIQAQIPAKFTLLCGGFPCQAFSIAGHQKGFADTRGTLFFEIEKIAQKHRPKVLFLENVKNLKTHDNGRTYAVIENALKALNYAVFSEVLNSATHANIPQNRERIFIVAFDKAQVPKHAKFAFPPPIKLTKTIHDCLEKTKQNDIFYYTPESPYYAWLKKAMTKKDTIYQLRRVYVRENKSKLCPTLTANMGTGGHNVPLVLDKWGIRKLTPRECFNFQGYPREFKLPNIANSALYKQAGNSITLPLVARIATQIFKVLL